jgi:microcystin-dependent protein
MSEPFLSEIRICSFNFAPKGWAFCNGQVLPINQNQALFSLLGTTYGGNGTTTFALPNLQGRTPVHIGNGIGLGNLGGEANHSLLTSEIPSHTHQFSGTSSGQNSSTPSGLLANSGGGRRPLTAYAPPNNLVALHPGSIPPSGGGSQPHTNMQPYLTLNFVIALQGIYPSRN